MSDSNPSFNLVDQLWIPCVTKDGAYEQLGLEAVFHRAHELREIYEDSPLIVVSIYRLLLAVTHHVLAGPADMSAWAKLWNAGEGRFEAARFTDYLRETTRYRRFDLFDAERPFYQTAEIPFDKPSTKGTPESYAKSIAKLTTELSANDTLFHHEIESVPQAVTAAQAARLVLAAQNFSMGGRVTFEHKDDGSADASPLVKGALALLCGDNLFQTLVLNLVRYDGRGDAPFLFDPARDRPAWDRAEPARSRDRKLEGYLDLLTWQSRRLRLRPEVGAEGELIVRDVVVMKGEQFVDGFHRRSSETMVAFTHNKDAKEKQDPWPTVGFSEDRALWRNSLAFLESVDAVRARPKTMTWIEDLRGEGHLSDRDFVPLSLFGLASDQAKVLLWRHELMLVPLKLLGNVVLLKTLEEALRLCEELRKTMWSTATEFARVLLMQTTDIKKQPGSEQKKDMQKIVDSLEMERRYWAKLQVEFVSFLGGDLIETDPPEDDDMHLPALLAWKATLRRVAKGVFAEVIAREDGSSRTLKAAVAAERSFDASLLTVLGPVPSASTGS